MELTVEPPSEKSSAKKLIKETYRQSFRNWRSLWCIFYWPSFYWCLGCGIVLASAYYGYMVKSWGLQKTLLYLVPLAIIGMIVQTLANCELALRTSAFSRAVIMQETKIENSLQDARRERHTILLLSTPVLVSELLSSSLIFTAQFMTGAVYDWNASSFTPTNLVVALMQFLYYVTWLPHMALYTINGFLLATGSQKRCNFGEVIDHFVGAYLPSFFYFCKYVMAVTAPCILFFVPQLLALSFDKIIQWFFLREAVIIFTTMILVSPIATFFFANAAIGGGLLFLQKKQATSNN